MVASTIKASRIAIMEKNLKNVPRNIFRGCLVSIVPPVSDYTKVTTVSTDKSVALVTFSTESPSKNNSLAIFFC